jgi:hypothetical protein
LIPWFSFRLASWKDHKGCDYNVFHPNGELKIRCQHSKIYELAVRIRYTTVVIRLDRRHSQRDQKSICLLLSQKHIPVIIIIQAKVRPTWHRRQSLRSRLSLQLSAFICTFRAQDCSIFLWDGLRLDDAALKKVRAYSKVKDVRWNER